MDVTDKESILKVKTYIEEKEGKLHVLVNKFVRSIYSWGEILVIDVILHPAQDSSVRLRPFSTIKKRRKIKLPSPLEQRFSIATHLKVGPVTLPSIWHQYFS
jgi:hypothetical protein